MKKLMQTDFEEIKETDTQLPSSRREIEEDMLEQICLIANAGAEITVEELCGQKLRYVTQKIYYEYR